MTQKRLQGIVNKVMEQFQNRYMTPKTIKEVYDTISKIIRGLHRSEHFLDVAIDYEAKYIIVRNEETMEFISLLPYLDNRLMDNDTLFMVYFLHPHNIVTLQGAIEFRDLSKDHTNTIGYTIKDYGARTLGIYYIDTNEFRRFQ